MRNYSQNGFTIVELLVVIFIITTITSLSVVYYRQGERQLAFQRTINKIAQDIRKVQEMAMAGKKCPPPFVCTLESRYGIKFEAGTSSYLIFVDRNGDGVYRGNDDAIIEEGRLEKRATIESIIGEKDGQEFSLSDVYLTFLLPDPTTIIKDENNNSFLIAKIKIKYENQERRIMVNKFGLIASE